MAGIDFCFPSIFFREFLFLWDTQQQLDLTVSRRIADHLVILFLVYSLFIKLSTQFIGTRSTVWLLIYLFNSPH